MEGVGIAIFWGGFSLFAYGLGTLVGRCNAGFISYIWPAATFDCQPDAATNKQPQTSKPVASTSGGVTFPSSGQCPKGYLAYKDQFGQVACVPLSAGGPFGPGPHPGGGSGA